MTNCPASVHVLHYTFSPQQANCYLQLIWLVISKKAKDATVGAFGSAGDSQSINQSVNEEVFYLACRWSP